MRLRHSETGVPFLFFRNFLRLADGPMKTTRLSVRRAGDVENSGIGTYTPAVAPVIDLLHLLVVATGVGVGAWALIALRGRLPRGRFVICTGASGAALFGCAALSGEVGLLPPAAWFAIVMGFIAAIVVMGYRVPRAPAAWR